MEKRITGCEIESTKADKESDTLKLNMKIWSATDSKK